MGTDMFFKEGYFYFVEHYRSEHFYLPNLFLNFRKWKEAHAEGINVTFLGLTIGWRRENMDFLLNDEEIKKIISKKAIPNR